jgi:hypothetical protein
MKQHILFFIFCLISFNIYSQSVPQGFNFQAVASDDAGNIISNQVIGIRVSLVLTSNNNNIVYRETQFPSSSDLGVFSIIVGQGTPDLGDFASVDWATEPLSLRTEIDINGGTDFVSLNPIQLFSVPYALYAESSGGGGGGSDEDPTNELQTLGRVGNMITLTDGGSVEDFINDADADPLNEIQTLQLTMGNQLAILDAFGNVVNEVIIPMGGTDADADPTNEIQTLGRTGNMITLTDGGDVEDFVNDADSDPTNEIQTLTKAGNMITLSDGGSVEDSVDDADSDSENEIQYFGLTGEQLQLINPDGSIESSVDFETIVDLGGENSPWTEDPGSGVVAYEGLAELNDNFGNQSHLQADNLHFHTSGESFLYAFDGAYYNDSNNNVGLGENGLFLGSGSNTSDFTSDFARLENSSFGATADLSPGFLFLEEGGSELEVALIGGVAEIATETSTHMVFQTDGNDRMTIEPGGNIGINTFFPDNLLHINGSGIFYPVRLEGAGATDWEIGVSNSNFFRLYPGGAQWASLDPNSLTWSVNSDRKLKTDITKLESSLEKLMALDVKRYRYKDRSQKTIGLIAQDVEKIFPELVRDEQISEKNMETVKSLNYSSFIYINIKAIQELNSKIEEQNKQLNKQQALIDKLIERLEALENK